MLVFHLRQTHTLVRDGISEKPLYRMYHDLDSGAVYCRDVGASCADLSNQLIERTVNTLEEVKTLQKVTLYVSRELHGLMKQYSKRKRISLGLAYDNAMQLFLSQTKQYMGTKHQPQLQKGIKRNG
jgi:hypothetical protein